MTYVRECMPEKFMIIRPQDKPWFDSGLRKAVKLRNRLRNKSLKSKNPFDVEKFRKARNKVNNMKKHAMLNYYNNLETQLSDDCINNSKLYWKLLKDTFFKTKSTDIPLYRIYL
jgi:hypothetical protein